MNLENKIAPAGSYTGSADSMPRRTAERTHRIIAAQQRLQIRGPKERQEMVRCRGPQILFTMEVSNE